MGTEKQSKAARERWSKIPKEDRTALMKKVHKARKKKWQELTPAERSAHGTKMIRTRWGKEKKKVTA